MNRRQFLSLAVLGAVSPVAAMAANTGSPVDKLTAQLRKQGFEKIDISRTWLGRTRIVARSDTFRREIILNSRSGEILRDYWEQIGENGESESGLFDPEDDYDDDDEMSDGSNASQGTE